MIRGVLGRWLLTLSRRTEPARFRPRGELLEGRLLLNAGALDPNFGTGGVFVGADGPSARLMIDEAVQADGKIVVAGDGTPGFNVRRFNPNGSLDANFGSGGLAPPPSISAYAQGVALDGDGKILAAGIDSGGAPTQFVVARYNANGTLDTSFGGNGAVATRIGTGASTRSVAVQADGKIVVAGSVQQLGGPVDVVRYGPDGSLDPTFGIGGIAAVTPLFFGAPFVSRVLLQPDGKVVVGGLSDINVGSHFLLLRLLPDGLPDATFGLGGQMSLTVGTFDRFSDLGLQGDGKIVTVGSVVARITDHGAPDPSFGTGGVVLNTFGIGSLAESIALQPDGKILVARDPFALARFNADGSVDGSFGSGGMVPAAVAGSAARVSLQGNGIVVAGIRTTPNTGDGGVTANLILARYLNDVTAFLPLQAGAKVFATGADAGGGPDVKVFDAVTGHALFSFFAFDTRFTGGVRVAVGDVNGDGVPDIICAAGPGGGPNVIVYSGKDGAQLLNFYAYDRNFTGGAYVAAGDVNGDGFDDIIVGADAGGGPNATIFSGKDGSSLGSFFPYDRRFTGGVRVAGGDVNGDGQAEVITGAGAGGGPNVSVYRFVAGEFQVLQSYFAYDVDFSAGIYVSAGDVNGDGKADVVVGAGAGGGPNVAVFNGTDSSVMLSYFPYDIHFTGGVRVAAVDRNGTGRADVISVPGPGGGPDVRTADGVTGQQIDDFFAYDIRFTGGLFVAASGPPNNRVLGDGVAVTAPAGGLSSQPDWVADVPPPIASVTPYSLRFTARALAGQRMASGSDGPTNNITWSAWIKPDAGLPLAGTEYGSQAASLHTGNEVAAAVCLTNGTGGNYQLAAAINGAGGTFSGGTVVPGVWNHVAVTVTTAGGPLTQLFVNGELVNTSATAPGVFSFVTLGYAANGNLAGDSGYTSTVGATLVPYGGLITDVRIWSTALAASDITTLYSGRTPATPVRRWYKCNEGSGTVVHDSGPARWVGYLSSSPTYSTDVPSPIGSGHSLQFTDNAPSQNTGTLQMVELYGAYRDQPGFLSPPASGTLTVGGVPNWTFSTWVKVNNANANTRQLLTSDYFGGRGIFLLKNGSDYDLSLYFNDSGRSDGLGGSDHLSAGTISGNAWHHVAVSVSGSLGNGTATFYLDGSVSGTVSGVPIYWFGVLGRAQVFDNPFAGMGNPFRGQEGLNGWLDDPRFYRTGLSASDIAMLASGSAVPGAVLHFSFDDGNTLLAANDGSWTTYWRSVP